MCIPCCTQVETSEVVAIQRCGKYNRFSQAGCVVSFRGVIERGYCSILLLSYSILSSSALGSPGLLPYSKVTLALHITTILTITILLNIIDRLLAMGRYAVQGIGTWIWVMFR